MPNTSDTSVSSGTDQARKDVIRELIETERKFVGDLEVMRVSRHEMRPLCEAHTPTLRSHRNTRQPSEQVV